jgi:Domain of unknown function (DUF4338)/Transposase DNA-binding
MQLSSSIKQTLSEPLNTKLVLTLLEQDPPPSRHSLAKALCKRLNLRDAKGDWQLATTGKALRELEARGCWQLPAPRSSGPGAWHPMRLNRPVPLPSTLPESVEGVRGLRLVEVLDDEHLRIWNELMLGEHPLQDARLVGRQLRYLLGSDHGWLGGIGFGSAALYLEGRDDWIGWDPCQRRQYLERVLNMNRFLIRPQVHCANLASHVLALCARRVGEDFERRYGLRPWLLESFVETPAHDGACYKAANWIGVGQTKGRGRNGSHHADKSLKDVYLYALVKDFPDRVGVKPPTVSALNAESGLDGPGWAGLEFGDCELGDERLTRRLVKIVCDQAAQPQGSYAQAAGGSRHDLKGYYRLLNNQRAELNPESLLESHRARTLRRMSAERKVLIVQDSTDLNYSTHIHCRGLGQIGTNQTGAKSRGLRLHSSLALSQSGLPLGVVQLQGAAPESAKGKDRQRPIEQKDSYRWLAGFAEAMQIAALLPHTQVISIADREGDMFELFAFRRSQMGRKAELLVRAKTDRCLEETDQKLFAELAASPLAKRVWISVPRQREHLSLPSVPGRPALKAREAGVEIRFKEVTLRAPNTSQTRNLEPIKLWAVYLVEKHPPQGAEALEWLLLTTLEVRSPKQARKCIRWYCRRWRIEEWHRVLKSGCKVLEHQHHSAQVLLRAIAIDAVIAWRIMLLALLGREVPELPCDVLFDPIECEVLGLLAKKKGTEQTLPRPSHDPHCQTGRIP